MKIFIDGPQCYGKKVNFVDENNVFLGYDLAQDCCEHADWFIASKPVQVLRRQPKRIPTMDGWVFDTTYFQEFNYANQPDGEDWNDLDSGGMAVFRIVNGDKEKFIHIYNAHNGYYGHGFEFKIGDETKQEGIL